jgi:hypothetical protein
VIKYNCVSDRYDNDGTSIYDGVGDFIAMCEEGFGEAPELREIGAEWHDEYGLVLVPVSTVTIRRPGETAWAEGVPVDQAEAEVERANRVAPGHRAYPEAD